MFSSRDAFENDFCPGPGRSASAPCTAPTRTALPQTGGERLRRCAGDAGAVLLQEKPSAFAGAGDCRKLQRTRSDFNWAAASAPRSTRCRARRRPARVAPSSSYGNRKPITLSTKPLSTFAPFDDEVEDEDFAQAVTAWTSF